MRVAYVCADPGIPVYGSKGCALHVQEVVREFNLRGDSVDLFAINVGGEPPTGCESVRVHTIPVRHAQSEGDREQALAAANYSLASLLDELSSFDLVYERHSLWSSAAMEWAAAQGIESILEVNAPLIDEQATHRTLVDRQLALDLACRSIAASQVVACVSKAVASYALSLGVEENRLVVVPNGVRPERFSLRQPRLQASDPFRIGFIGSLRPWHAVDDLVRAFALLHTDGRGADSQLVIIGDGPHRHKVAAQVAELPNAIRDRIELVGAVSPAEIPSRLARLDVGVAPYAAGGDCYFSPLKLFEYMAAGLPTVVADAGQMCEIVKSGATGFAYQPGDLNDLAARLDWIRREPAAAERMGCRAREEVAQHHTWTQRLSDMLEATHTTGSTYGANRSSINTDCSHGSIAKNS